MDPNAYPYLNSNPYTYCFTYAVTHTRYNADAEPYRYAITDTFYHADPDSFTDSDTVSRTIHYADGYAITD